MPKKSPLDDVWVSVEPRRAGAFHLLAVVVSLALFGWLYFFLAGVLIATTNQNVSASDQAHNIKRALLSKQYEGVDISQGQLKGIAYWWPHDTDGVVAPLWSRVAGSLAEPGHKPSEPGTVTDQDKALFERGKWFNVWFSFGFLCVLTLGAAWAFPGATLPVINLMLLSGLGALLPRAVYFQPEPLYYAFFAGTWICCLMALLGNRILPYIAAGLFAGLAFLTKTSVQPLLLAFFAITGLRMACGLFGIGRTESNPLLWGRSLGGLVLMAGVFVALIWPRLDYSRREFGDRFHSYPGYWMWMDTFDECYAWMAAHPGRYELEDLTPEEKPSAINYWKSHTWRQIAERAENGWLKAMERGYFPRSVKQSGWEAKKPWKHLLPSRGWLLLGLTGLVCGTALIARRKGERFDAPTQRAIIRATRGDRFFATVFVLMLVGGYSFAYGWYEAIGGGERFMLALFTPLVFSLIWAGQAMTDHLPSLSPWRRFYHWGNVAILMFILFRIANLLAHPVF
ncbi:MAG: hypothetical protein O3C21_19015, partial [Verrucomicrobia bacterium]|nr:hypothetical protein [Verrucomicrobiota bacterium]